MIPSIPLSTRVVASAGSFTVQTKTATPSRWQTSTAAGVTTAQFRVAARAPAARSQRGRRRGRSARSPASTGRTTGREHAAAGHAEPVLGVREGTRQRGLRRRERREDRQRVRADEAPVEQAVAAERRDDAGLEAAHLDVELHREAEAGRERQRLVEPRRVGRHLGAVGDARAPAARRARPRRRRSAAAASIAARLDSGASAAAPRWPTRITPRRRAAAPSAAAADHDDRKVVGQLAARIARARPR